MQRSQPAPVANTTGGTLATGTRYYAITSLGLTGESTDANEDGSNEVSVAVTGPTGSVDLQWEPVPGVSGYRVYAGSASGAENEYWDVGNVTSWTDTGAAGTAASPPATETALGSARYTLNSNAIQSAVALPTGTTINDNGKNIVVSSGLLDPTTGLLTSAYASSKGTVGAEL